MLQCTSEQSAHETSLSVYARLASVSFNTAEGGLNEQAEVDLLTCCQLRAEEFLSPAQPASVNFS